jgi:uncharacterized protein YcaQ
MSIQSHHAATYWVENITRREFQKVQDDNARQINALTEASHKMTQLLAQLSMTLAFLADKVGAEPGEFQTYLDTKQKEFKALTAAQAKESLEKLD